MATGWEQVVAALTTGSPTPTSAGEKIRVDAAIDTDAYPFIVGHSVAVERIFGLDNTLMAKKQTYHLECWGETREQANQLEEEVVTALIAAGLIPDANGPDGMDPTVDVRCADVFVPTWITPEVI
jgi:hypothetical protein